MRYSVAEPELPRDAALAPNLMFNINGLSKMSQTVTFCFFPFTFMTTDPNPGLMSANFFLR
jgi:hypothetical protein